MPWYRKFAYYLGGLLVVFILLGLLLPSTAQVEREIDIDAPAASVFALLNDFHRVREWSPWVEADPNALYEIAGPRRGVGASLSWDGQIVGQGRQRIVVSEPYERVVSELELGGQGQVTSTFLLQESPAGTHVNWVFENAFGLNLFGRYFGLLLDRVVGPDFDTGLANLKALAEGLPPANFADIEIEHLTIESVDIVYLPTSSVPEAGAIAAALGDAYFELLNYIDNHELRASGSPMSIGGTFSGAQLHFNAAIPVRGDIPDRKAPASGVQHGKSYDGRVIRVKHLGSYRTLGVTHDKVAAYLAALGIRRNGEAWESYVTDPTRVRDDELVTYVYYPVADEPQ